jgi:hypothetical protein
MGVTPVDAAPAEMIGKPRGMGAFDQCPEPLEVLAVGVARGAEVHRDAMLDDAILLEDFVEHIKGAAGIDHEVLRNNLEPIDDRLLFEDMPVMRHAQADADAVVGLVIERIGGHWGKVRNSKSEKKQFAYGAGENWKELKLANSRAERAKYFEFRISDFSSLIFP